MGSRTLGKFWKNGSGRIKAQTGFHTNGYESADRRNQSHKKPEGKPGQQNDGTADEFLPVRHCRVVSGGNVHIRGLHHGRGLDLMGQTSLLMFPIYGMGACCSNQRFIDSWLTGLPGLEDRGWGQDVPHRADDTARAYLHGADIHCGICGRNLAYKPWDLPVGLLGHGRTMWAASSALSSRPCGLGPGCYLNI